MRPEAVAKRVWPSAIAVGARLHPVMQPFIDSIRMSAVSTLPEGHDGDPPRDDWTHRSDEGPFSDRGIPFIQFGNEEHEDYHQPTDVFERINPGFYYHNMRTIAEFVRRLDRGLDPVAADRATRR